jgi:hypothetical protein
LADGENKAQRDIAFETRSMSQTLPLPGLFL